MESAQIGIIGGSGLYDMAEVTERQEVVLATPFGAPSGPYVLGTLRERRVAVMEENLETVREVLRNARVPVLLSC